MGCDITYMPIQDFEREYSNRLLEVDKNDCHSREFVKLRKTRYRNNDSKDEEGYSTYVDLILEAMGLEKHAQLFQKHNIGIDMLFKLDINDLKNIGLHDIRDQERFIRHQKEFSVPDDSNYDVIYRMKEDLAMVQNIHSHLFEINSHLSFISFAMSKADYNDYFINSKYTALGVLKLIINRALTQTSRITNFLFDGSFEKDNLIVASLEVDNLQLPEFIKEKLMSMCQENQKPKRRKVLFTMLFAVGLVISAAIYKNNLLKTAV